MISKKQSKIVNVSTCKNVWTAERRTSYDINFHTSYFYFIFTLFFGIIVVY